MQRTSDSSMRHNLVSSNNSGTNKQSAWKSITGLFIVQFLLSQLVFSYGMYSVYLIHETVPISELLLAPLVLLSVWKIFNPWCRDLAESFNESCFRWMFFLGIMMCAFGVSINVLSSSLLFRAIFYGGFAGFGTSLTFCLMQSRIFDLFQYQSTLIYSLQHLSIALGLFMTPHLINYIFKMFNSAHYVFFIHGVILLHALPASFLLGKTEIRKEQRLSKYRFQSSFDRNGEELINMASGRQQQTRSWRCPSERVESIQLQEDLEHEIPAPHEKCTLGVDVLPEIPEESEDSDSENEERNEDSKINSAILNNNIKRLSVISSKLEELIDRDEDIQNLTKTKEIILDANKSMEVINIVIPEVPVMESNTSLFRDLRKSKRNNPNNYCCCTPYQKFRYRRRFKSCFDSIIGLTIKPLISSFRVAEFYPCLITIVHSMLSPLIFLNFTTIKASQALNYGSLTEVSFMLSITAFAYICFLITLPWVVDISKRNLRYLYICGLITSAVSIYLMRKNSAHDYMTVSCLVYGFGFGIESYCQEIVVKEYLGVKNWSKVEGTLDFLSGFLLITMVTTVNSMIETMYSKSYMKMWFTVVFFSHMIVTFIWIIFPITSFIYRYAKNRNRNRDREIYNIIQQT